MGRGIKRAMDIAVALTGLVLLAPLIVVVVVAIYVTMGSPILFRQTRPGHRAQPFEVIKFRTMRPAADSLDEHKDNERLTRLGRLLRRTSVDELPQLWNVLKGDLSLVGPRPLLMEYLPLYDAEQARRHEVRPGITGWAQINGRNAITWDEKFRYDLWYVEHWSLWLDIKILARTARSAASGKGVSGHGVATADVWPGNGRAALRDDKIANG